MKYYAELSKLEEQIIRLDSMQSLLRLISEGAQNNHEKDVLNALWYITGTIEDINQNLSQQFQELWDTVREDTVVDDMSDPWDETPVNNSAEVMDELNTILASWIRERINTTK